jgi:uncharacterized protein (UPF0262 family)
MDIKVLIFDKFLKNVIKNIPEFNIIQLCNFIIYLVRIEIIIKNYYLVSDSHYNSFMLSTRYLINNC